MSSWVGTTPMSTAVWCGQQLEGIGFAPAEAFSAHVAAARAFAEAVLGPA